MSVLNKRFQAFPGWEGRKLSGHARRTISVRAALVALLLSSSFVPARGLADDSEFPVALRSFPSHSRLSFRLPEGFRTDWKESTDGRGFELLIRGAMLTDLGAPLGEEKEWISRYLGLSDSRVAGVKLMEREDGILVTGKFLFPKGEQAPAVPRMEHFEYRDKEAGRFVVDFWLKAGPTVAQVRRAKEIAERKEVEKTQIARAERRAARKIAADKARVELEDVVAFCKRPLDEESDVFLQFEPVRQPFSPEKELAVPMPDHEYPWAEVEADQPDGKYVRLARKLYEEGKFALVLKTIEFFENEHKESIYRREMRFMRANARLRLGLAADARHDLEEVILNSPESFAAEQSASWLAIEALKQGDQLGALERFLWLIRHHGDSKRAWVYHMAAADALSAMKQTERAAKEYQWVSQNAPDEAKRAEGAVRIGDLFFVRRQYERSLASYFQATHYFPKQVGKFPALALNRAESLYWLKQYDRSGELFSEFLKDFPNHPAGWRAYFRLGEIEGRKQGEVAQAKSREYWMEAVNRHPFSAGAVLGRLRLLPCGDHGGFDTATAARFFEGEAASFDGRDEVRMERWDDFLALAQIRSWISIGSNQRAIDSAIRALESGAQTEVKRQILTLLKLVFRKEILALLDAGKRIEALRFYGSRIDQFPSIRTYRDEQVDPDYLLRLSQAATELQLGEVARGLLEQYEQAQVMRGKSYAEASSEEGRAPASNGEDEDDLDRRREESETAYTEAQSLWLKSGLSEAAKVLEKLGHVDSESSRAYAAKLLASRIEQLRKQPREALRDAIAARMLMPISEAKIPGETDRVDYWIAQLQLETGDQSAGMASLQGLLGRAQLRAPASGESSAAEKSGETATAGEPVRNAPAVVGVADRIGIPIAPGRRELLLAKADLLEKGGRWGEAASAYSEVVSQSSSGDAASKQDAKDSDYLRFAYARALSRSGSADGLDKAKDLFRSLASDAKDEVWKKLARENLDSLGSGH